MTKRYLPSRVSQGVLAVRPRERVAVEDVSGYLAGLIESGEIASRRYLPSAAPHPSPTPRSGDDKLVEPVKVNLEGVRYWVVARAAPGCERRVAADLAAEGFATYCPLGRRFSFQARFPGTKRRARAIKQFCVFAPYLFVGATQGREIGKHAHDKIAAVLSDAGGPIHVQGQIIAAINALEMAGQWYDTKSWREQTRLGVGAQVRVTGGPFVHLSGIIEGLPEEMRVKVTLNLFGRATPVMLDACQVELV